MGLQRSLITVIAAELIKPRYQLMEIKYIGKNLLYLNTSVFGDFGIKNSKLKGG